MDKSKKRPSVNFWSCRQPSPIVPPVAHHPTLQYHELQTDEQGRRKLVPAAAVAPSMADDFTPVINSLNNRFGSAPIRSSVDMVDLTNKLKNLE